MNDDSKTSEKNTQQDGGKIAFACQLKAARERTGKNQSQFFSLIKKGKSPGHPGIIAFHHAKFARCITMKPTTVMI